MSPEFLTKLQMAKLLVDTDNSNVLEGGVSHKLKTFNIDVYMSNNLPKEGNKDICILRTKKAISFAEQLKEATGLTVNFWDERRTTVEAHNILSQHNYHGKKRKDTVDAVAASLILEGYLSFRSR